MRRWWSGVIVPAGLAIGVAVTPGSGQVQLTDQTAAAQLIASHAPLVKTIGRINWMTGGIATGDFDRDGYADVFMPGGGGGGPDYLFINDRNGGFSNQAAAWGLNDVHCGNAAAVGDFDGDGWLDIYVTSFGDVDGPSNGAHRLYRNVDGTGFVDVAAAAGVHLIPTAQPSAFGAAFGDYDLDGHLDLFVASWGSFGAAGGVDGHRLFRNDGDGTFTDVTLTAIGSAPLVNVWGFQPAFVDMDGDRYPELLLAADFRTSRYFRNNADGTFTDFTGLAGVGLDDNGMGQTVADFDNDQALDWYVTSIHKDNPFPGDVIGNMLYRAIGAHVFEEISMAAQVNDGGWGWGTLAVDFDQDGWIDIVEVNGREAKPPIDEWTAEPPKLFYNGGAGTFTEIGAAAGLTNGLSGRGVAYLDLENDGDLDLVISNASENPELYRNDTLLAGNWLQLTFDTSAHPGLAPDGFGVRAEVTTGATTQVRVQSGNPSYLATSQLVLHYGLGSAGIVDQVVVRWPNGLVTTLENLAINQRLNIAAPTPWDLNGDGWIDVEDLLALINGWGACPAPPDLCLADVDGTGSVDVEDVLALVNNWSPPPDL